MIVVGVDPGITGALAFIDSRGTAVVEDIPTIAVPGGGMVKRRVDGYGMAKIVRAHCPIGESVLVVCEAVHAMPGNAMQTQGSLLRSLGAIEAVFDVLRLSPRMVSPQSWQAAFGLKGKKTEKRERGELPAAIVIARKLYPMLCDRLELVKRHNRAEACLIAAFGQERFA